MKDDELQKVTLNLFKGDYRRVQDLFPEVGAGKVIRQLVRKFLDQSEGDRTLPKTEVKL